MDQIVLVIDDDVTSLKRATGIMEKEYRVAAATGGELAFKYLEKNRPDLILLDINMPGMDGFEVMEKLKADPRHADIPVIFLAATQSPENEAQCLEAGAVDFVNKPFIPQVLISRVRRVMELSDYRNNGQGASEGGKGNDIRDAVIMGMANLIEERDNSTGHHVKNTQAYVRMLCEALIDKEMYTGILTTEYMDKLIRVAPLHDLGKIKITDAILQKNGKLSEEEYRIVQNHARYGADIIDEILADAEDREYYDLARDVALYHHERWDGSGYPEGIAGEEIPLGARIMTIADVFDALSDDRVYHRGIKNIDKVFSILEESSGTQFDPALVEAFASVKDKVRDYLEEEDYA